MDIKNIKDPKFVKDLSNDELVKLSADIRKFLINSISKTGGHLSSNLGVVELTIALHKTFDSPKDKFIFDVGHQTYIHKILTGRADKFDTLRQYNGISGFQKRSESEHDIFESGHSSNSISVAAGMAMSRDLNKEQNDVIAIIGDSSIQNGMALEAMNNIGEHKSKVIVILNDNEMSISQNVGMISKTLNATRISKWYRWFKHVYEKIMPGFVVSLTNKTKRKLLIRIKLPTIFENLGFDYIGPIDGHNFKQLNKALEKAKSATRPILVHVKTKKGKGYDLAEQDKVGKWHGTGAFQIENGEPLSTSKQGYDSWSKIVANEIENKMEENKDIVMITPAMIEGSKLSSIFAKYPERSFDTGMTEGHTITFGAGLALAGKWPITSIYSTFAQRGYDQLQQDVARLSLRSTYILDRANLVGEDGETHHGIYDTAMLFSMPNAIVMAPSNSSQVKPILELCEKYNGPSFIRIPRGNTKTICEKETVEFGKWKMVNNIENPKAYIVAYGPHVHWLKDEIEIKNLPLQLIDALFLKPFDEDMVKSIVKTNKPVYFADTVTLPASLYTYVGSIVKLGENVESIAIKDKFVTHGSQVQLEKEEGIDIDTIINKAMGK